MKNQSADDVVTSQRGYIQELVFGTDGQKGSIPLVIIYISIERENLDLDGVLTNTTYNDKRKYPDD